jgi:hypothetical protein
MMGENATPTYPNSNLSSLGKTKAFMRKETLILPICFFSSALSVALGCYRHLYLFTIFRHENMKIEKAI